jgi:hypothetical protein
MLNICLVREHGLHVRWGSEERRASSAPGAARTEDAPSTAAVAMAERMIREVKGKEEVNGETAKVASDEVMRGEQPVVGGCLRWPRSVAAGGAAMSGRLF